MSKIFLHLFKLYLYTININIRTAININESIEYAITSDSEIFPSFITNIIPVSSMLKVTPNIAGTVNNFDICCFKHFLTYFLFAPSFSRSSNTSLFLDATDMLLE